MVEQAILLMMKYFFLAAVAAAATAQTISDLPACSINCFAIGMEKTSCALTDYKCACSKTDMLRPILTPCIQQSCPKQDDHTKVIEVIESVCKNLGVPVTINTSSMPVVGTTASSASVPVASSISAPSTPTAKPSTLPTTSPSSSGSICPIVTETVIMTIQPSHGQSSVPVASSSGSSRPTVPFSSAPPFPTPSSVTRSSTSRLPSGAGSPIGSATPLPSEFPGAAAAVHVPAFAGVLGVMALIL
ncbi:hypothetical protein CC80DRAFT_540766 [Byssothecium circinans]|uniref:CFEM domain-containing protein n=1 Tax=Byssothecium circinans TaxID=147558 RepID=A0A6A5T7Y3_9PLEO|nr:hypothetical protein CC80DRAFT_540766 [Byssothecium circinans]